MPKRTDIRSILVVGSGPIVIGQACEFDYSGTQACRVLKEEGYRVVLANSNPATIMTDPDVADRTYVEPLTPAFVEKIIERERPDALLPTLGGQTALNVAVALARSGALARHGVELIGCDVDVIERGEDRRLFAQAMEDIGLECARAGYAHSVEEAAQVAERVGLPCVVRPSFTMGGAGGGLAKDGRQLAEIVRQGIDLSPVGEVLIEESIAGWKEFEMEVMRDAAGNGIVVCSIENVDPMGVHTGDSITVAPAQTLTDPEYQRMRTAALAVVEKIGVETGGSNVQFAVNPADGRLVVIEMNPRVSRSSALASKATGFPIAKAAARLAVGYTLDEIRNDVTRATPACFEPALDYCVVKMPRFAFEKFKGADDTLTTRMKAVGEAMAIGRSFEEALGKAARSLEDGHAGLGFCEASAVWEGLAEGELARAAARPSPERLHAVAEALRRGWDVGRVHGLCGIDPWFLSRMADMVAVGEAVRGLRLEELDAPAMRVAKRYGLSDAQIAFLTGAAEPVVRAYRKGLGVLPTFKTVDTCAAEFEGRTEYHYKTYEEPYLPGPCANERRGAPSVPPDAAGATPAFRDEPPRVDAPEISACDKPKALILGAGPNRIGQGIEFDYCCVHASYALAEAGFETIMANCNPETVSTDYDASDRLYFEPLTFEDVMDVVDAERPDGVVVGLGGQTPLGLAHALEESGVRIMGTPPAAIDMAEDRDRFSALLDDLGISYPAAGTARSVGEACTVARDVGFPCLVRPSYVLGGRGMAIAYDEAQLRGYMEEATRVSPDRPVYLDRFLEGAMECDVDAVCDGKDAYVGGVLEHIEEAGIHSGDSAACLPPFSFSDSLVEELRETTRRLALALRVKGLINVQYAIHAGAVHVIEANPRASRTVPFVSKATGVPLAKCAALVMAGRTLDSLGLPPEGRAHKAFFVKEAVMPWGRFPGADVVLGPEMKSTGEVMGVADTYPAAYAKSQLAISYALPKGGNAFISVCDRDKRHVLSIARAIERLGFTVLCTEGTARVLSGGGVRCRVVRKASEEGQTIADLMAAGQVAFMINTPFGEETRSDGYLLRTQAVRRGITCITALSTAAAFVAALESLRDADGDASGAAAGSGVDALDVAALQDLAG